VSPRTAFDRHVLREALPISASQIVWVVRMYLPTLALWYLVPRASVAHFDVAHRVYMVLQAILTVYLMNLYTPLSRAVNGPRKRLVGLLGGSTALGIVAALAAALVIGANAGPLLGVLFGNTYNTGEGAATLTTFGLMFPVLTMRGHGHYALVALGRPRRELACSVAACGLLVVLLFAWIPNGGLLAAARAMLVSESLGLVLVWVSLAVVLRKHGVVHRDAEIAQAV
jgi:O-antigen/teichoic acid export membrane protein